MIELLKQIVDVITVLIDFLKSVVFSLIDLLVNLPVYLTFLTRNVYLLPSIVIPFVLASISTYVLLLILGRNN